MPTWLEALVLAVAVAPVILVLGKRPIRRELAAHPQLAVGLVAAALVALAAGAWLSRRSPNARQALVVLAGSGAALAWVRARPGYGRTRGLPPGSLGLGVSLDAVDDPEFYHRAARRFGPVFKMSQIHQGVVCITDLELGNAFFKDQADALVQSDWPFNRLVPHGYLEFMNGEVYRRYYAILAPAFTPELLAACRPDFAELARRQLERMSRTDGGRAVDPEPFLYPIALPALLRVVLGVPIDDPAVDRFRELVGALNRPFDLFLPTPKPLARAYDRLTNEVASLAREPASARSVLGALVATDPAHGADPAVIGNLIMMVKDGSTIVRGLYRWLLKMMADDPNWAERIRAAADGGRERAADDLATGLVHETLRRYGSRYLYRRLVKDAPLGSYRLPRGWLVRLCVGEAHEDPDRFPDPTRFDPTRFAAGCPHHGYLPFGKGLHACIGADLTLAMATAFVKEAAAGFTIRTVADGDPWRINRHWGLWRPSLRFRIAIAARSRAGVAGSSSIQTPQAS